MALRFHQPPGQLFTCSTWTPPLDEQKAIARILGTLDDKVALNRRMHESLEAMAGALFKSWFQELYPVRAKVADLIQEGVLEIGDG